MKSILVIGMGRFGRHFAGKMQELGNDVMIVDKNAELVEWLAPKFADSHIGDCTNEDVVRSLGVSDFDACFVTIGENFQSSLVITSLLKKQNPKFLVAKANQDIQAELLLKIGADEIVYPERDSAEKAAVRFNTNNIFDYIQLTSEYSLFEIPVHALWVGKSIAEVDVRKKHKVNIIAVKSGNTLLPTPAADYVFKADDSLVVIGTATDVFKIAAKT